MFYKGLIHLKTVGSDEKKKGYIVKQYEQQFCISFTESN